MKTFLNQRGQMILESILILTILMAITLTTANYLKGNELVAGLISGPWDRLSSMIKNGVWMESKNSDAYHPNQTGRGASLAGESAR